MLSNTIPMLIEQNLDAPKMLPRAKSVVGSAKGGVLSGAEKRIGSDALLSKTDSSKLEKWKGAGMESALNFYTSA